MTDIGGARVRLDGDASGVIQAANQSNAALRSLGTNVAQNWWGLRNLSLAFAALPAAAAAGMGLAVRSAVQFETAMAGVERTTYDASIATDGFANAAAANAAALSGLQNEILEIARVTPVSTNALAGIAESAGALGVAQKDVGAFTKVVADLAATTNLTEEQAGKDLAGIAALTGLTAAGYDNLASAILEVGRRTAATETEITGASSKIASIAGVVGLSTDEVVGLAGALKSARVETSSGSTAIIKAMLGMKQAVEEGGPALDNFAKIANVSGERLQEIWNTEGSAAAFTQFIQGMGDANNAGINLTKTMGELGLTDIRVLRSLYNLGAAQSQTANQNARLSESLKISKEGFVEATAITEIAEKRYKTYQAQVQILKNNLFELGVIIGTTVLPVMKFFVNIGLDFVTGLRAMPGPLRAITVGLGLFVAALSGVISVAILFGARIALALGALSRMNQISASAGGGLAGLKAQFMGVASSANMAGVSIDRANAAIGRTKVITAANARAPMPYAVPRQSTRAPGMAGTTPGMGNFLPVVTKTAPAMDTAAKATTGFGKALGFLGKAAGGVFSAISALFLVTTLWGGVQRKVEERQKALFGVQEDLVQILRDEASGLHSNTNAWIQRGLMQQNALATAQKLGISYETLSNIVKGDVTSAGSVEAIRKIEEATKAGVPGAKELGDRVTILAKQFHASAAEAEVVKKATGQMAHANDAAAQGFDDLGESAANSADDIKKANQAVHDWISAVFSERSASIALEDAIDQLAQTREDAARAGEQEAAAIRSIHQARIAETRAIKDAAEARKEMLDARSEGAKAELDAEDDLYAANRRYEDLLRDIADKEEALTKLRAGPTMKQLIAATNKLRDAQLKLRDANQYVLDAEWQLQYLREEGGSTRDLTDAESALEDAHQDVANSTEDVADAQEELNDVRDGASAEELADAERELQDAYRETRSTYQEIINAEETLADIRHKNATDQFYLDAQQAYQDAQDAVVDAIHRTRDAERELQDLRDQNYAREIAKSELALEQALFDRAKAIAEVKKQQELMKDGTFTAKEEATALADALEEVAKQAPNSAARNRLLAYAAALRKVKDEAEGESLFTPTLPATVIDDPTKGLPNGGKVKLPPPDMGDWLSEIKKNLGTIGAGIGGAVGMIFGPVGSAIGAAIGGAIGSAIGGAIDNWAEGEDLLESATNVLIGLLFPWTNFSWFESVQKVFRDFVKDIREFFGIDSPSRVMMEIGSQLIAGLIQGLAEGAGRLFAAAWDLPQTVLRGIGNVFERVRHVGTNIVRGIVNGMTGALGELSGWMGNIYNTVIGGIGNSGRWLFDTGRNLLIGLYNGLVDIGGWFHREFVKFLKWLIPDPLERFFGISSPSKLMHQYGSYIMQGMQEGLETEGNSVIKTMEDISKQLAGTPARYTLSNFETAGMGALAPGTIGGMGATGDTSSVVNNYETNLNLTAVNSGTPADVIAEFMWKEQIVTRD